MASVVIPSFKVSKRSLGSVSYVEEIGKEVMLAGIAIKEGQEESS